MIEDDVEIQQRLAAGLKAAGIIVDCANSGADGRAMGELDDYDAVILDLGLPDMQGLEVLRGWRDKLCDMPVLILTARESWTDKVEGLNAGADDYITKPFHLPEITARLHALVRRRAGTASSVLRHKDILLDISTGEVTRNNQKVDLTAREFRMLAHFLHRVGRLVTQSELTEHLYSMDEGRESNTIEVYVSRLRRKLGSDIITTVRGLGYRMDR